MTDIDPAAMMAAHVDHAIVCNLKKHEPEVHCETYRLAEALAASEAKVARVEYLFADRPDTPCRTVWWNAPPSHPFDPPPVECVEVPIDELRAALADQPEQAS